MAAIAGTIDTRILIATGDAEPTEVGLGVALMVIKAAQRS